MDANRLSSMLNRANTALARPWALITMAAVLFIAINVLSQAGLRGARVDLTSDRLHTLTPATLATLAGLREPVSLTLYHSASLADEAPQLRVFGQRLREVLETYAAKSGGMISLKIIDPEPWSDAEDHAVEAGVTGLPLDRSPRRFYMGLVGTDLTDRREVIPFAAPEREPFLEHDLTRMIFALGATRKPVLGVLTDMPLEHGVGGIARAMRGGSRPYAIWTQLTAWFDVHTLKTDLAEIPGDVTVLLVARPRGLPDQTLHAIDQFVLRGGRTVMMVDPYVESDAEGGYGAPAPLDPSAVPTKLFDAWGLTLPVNRFVADPATALEVNSQAANGPRTVIHVPWLGLGPENRDLDDVATAELGMINVASAGALAVKDGAPVALTPLLRGSAESRLGDTKLLRGPPDPARAARALDQPPLTFPPVIAARVTGILRTAFPDGPPAPVAIDGALVAAPVPLTAPHIAKSAEPPHLVIITDTDMLEDRFWVEDRDAFGRAQAQPFAANGDLLLNLIDNMSGGADMIGTRGRAGASRPFIAVERLRRAAGERMLARQDQLTAELADTERRVAELQSKSRDGATVFMSAEERGAIEEFRAKALVIRKELRDVQRELNQDIDRLAALVKTINIAGTPALAALAALGVALWRARRRRARVAGSPP